MTNQTRGTAAPTPSINDAGFSMTEPKPAPRQTTDQLADRLRERIDRGTATVAVVGLGYVGLPLVRAIHERGFPVIGFDVDHSKIDKLKAGKSYMQHLGPELAAELSGSDRFTPTADEAALADADVVILCVPTPLGPHNDPDLSFVLSSTAMAGRHLQPGQLIVLESTTYPGTTRDEMGPLLTKEAAARGLDLEPGRDFFLAYSPEREDPGRPGVTTAAIPKLVGGTDPTSGELAERLYRRFIQHVHPVESAEVAEAAKLLENIYRAVNIAMVNELKIILDRLGIDIWKVIEAAKTKPFGFQAFYPGPGLGGHCIPIGHVTRFIELAGEINQQMPRLVVQRTMMALSDAGKPLRNAQILVIGLAYKPNVDDARESPAAEIIELLHEHGAVVRYNDPHIPEFPQMRRYKYDLSSTDLTPEAIKAADCVLIVTDHDKVDWNAIGEHAALIVDTRNAMTRAARVSGTLVKA